MRIRILMKDGTRYHGILAPGTTPKNLLKIMQGSRVLAFEEVDGYAVFVNIDAIASVEVLKENQA